MMTFDEYQSLDRAVSASGGYDADLVVRFLAALGIEARRIVGRRGPVGYRMRDVGTRRWVAMPHPLRSLDDAVRLAERFDLRWSVVSVTEGLPAENRFYAAWVGSDEIRFGERCPGKALSRAILYAVAEPRSEALGASLPF